MSYSNPIPMPHHLSLPETFINILQSLVSLRRIEKYMAAVEISDIRSIQDTQLENTIKLVSATISWPQNRFGGPSSAPSVAPTPKARFTISDLSLEFPEGELSLICGKLGKFIMSTLLIHLTSIRDRFWEDAPAPGPIG